MVGSPVRKSTLLRFVRWYQFGTGMPVCWSLLLMWFRCWTQRQPCQQVASVGAALITRGQIRVLPEKPSPALNNLKPSPVTLLSYFPFMFRAKKCCLSFSAPFYLIYVSISLIFVYLLFFTIVCFPKLYLFFFFLLANVVVMSQNDHCFFASWKWQFVAWKQSLNYLIRKLVFLML